MRLWTGRQMLGLRGVIAFFRDPWEVVLLSGGKSVCASCYNRMLGSMPLAREPAPRPLDSLAVAPGIMHASLTNYASQAMQKIFTHQRRVSRSRGCPGPIGQNRLLTASPHYLQHHAPLRIRLVLLVLARRPSRSCAIRGRHYSGPLDFDPSRHSTGAKHVHWWSIIQGRGGSFAFAKRLIVRTDRSARGQRG